MMHPSCKEKKKREREKRKEKETNVERVTEGKDERFYLHSFYKTKFLTVI